MAKCNETVKPTSVVEIKKIIKNLKPKKSAEVDNISNFMIKKLPSAFLDCLCSCFNDWLTKSFLPRRLGNRKNCHTQ